MTDKQLTDADLDRIAVYELEGEGALTVLAEISPLRLIPVHAAGSIQCCMQEMLNLPPAAYHVIQGFRPPHRLSQFGTRLAGTEAGLYEAAGSLFRNL